MREIQKTKKPFFWQNFQSSRKYPFGLFREKLVPLDSLVVCLLSMMSTSSSFNEATSLRHSRHGLEVVVYLALGVVHLSGFEFLAPVQGFPSLVFSLILLVFVAVAAAHELLLRELELALRELFFVTFCACWVGVDERHRSD